MKTSLFNYLFKSTFAALITVTATSSPSFAADKSTITETEAHEIAVEAYTYLYPLVTMDITRRQLTNSEAGKSAVRGPMNQFVHVREYPSADMREVVRPNFDTLYSSAWLDLTKEPLIVSAPDTAGRYYMLPILDMWSDVIAVPGWRTSGTKVAHFALVPPRWTGKLPADVQRIDVTTPYAWIIGRTQTNGPRDYAAVHKFQDGYKITPLSQWGKSAAKTASTFKFDPTVDMKTPPLEQVNNMTATAYFSYAAELLKINPPHASDWSTIARLKRIGFEVGKSFDLSQQSPEVRRGVENSATAGLQLMKSKIPTLARVTNGWQMNTDTMGVYGNYYLKRAIVAMVGLGANQVEDAIYPMNLTDSEGKIVEGQYDYVLHFNKEELPPAMAFWSITMYDEAGFQVANPLNRFAIGDRDQLTYNKDGSLDIFVQSNSPGADKESNWLPSPKTSGPLGITMRLYAPKQVALDGRWNPPALKKVASQSH